MQLQGVKKKKNINEQSELRLDGNVWSRDLEMFCFACCFVLFNLSSGNSKKMVSRGKKTNRKRRAKKGQISQHAWEGGGMELLCRNGLQIKQEWINRLTWK